MSDSHGIVKEWQRSVGQTIRNEYTDAMAAK